MKERLEQFLNSEHLTQAQFADKIGVARAGISHIMSGRNKPSFEFINNTIEAFPTLNIEWLLRGTGSMYKGTVAEQRPEPGMSLFDIPANNSLQGEQKPSTPSFEPEQSTVIQSQQLYENQHQASPQPTTVPQRELNIQSEPSLVQPITDSQKKNIAKIVVFYNDGTYAEID